VADLAVLVFRIEETVDGLPLRPTGDVHVDPGVVIVEVDPEEESTWDWNLRSFEANMDSTTRRTPIPSP